MWRIALSELNYDGREIEAVRSVLESGWITMGPRTAEFEQAFASVHGARHGVAVSNCTAALELTYKYVCQASGRHQIVVPDITFVASASAACNVGAEPVLCDVEAGDCPFLSPVALEHLLAENPAIGGVCYVHYAGYDHKAAEIAAVCSRFNVSLIEDCAHASGAFYQSGNPIGTVRLAACFSFFSNKNLATGEGGMVLTNDDDLAQWLRLARTHGLTAGTWDRHKSGNTMGYDVQFAATNARCTEMTAALGLVQLEKLAAGNRQRQVLTRRYHEMLKADERLSVLMPPNLDLAACHILSLVCSDSSQRDRIRTALTDAGIQTSHHYQPIHSFSWYRANIDSASREFPNASEFAARQITLPLYPGLAVSQVDEICEIILAAGQ